MKKFLRKVSIFLVFCILVTIVFPMLVDPYNVFHPDSIRDNGIEPNKNYIKTHYILENPDKYDSFMFGSSRVGSIHTENIQGENCYNMTYSFGLPQEIRDTIKIFIDGNVTMKHIYIGLDPGSYTFTPESHLTETLRCPYSVSINSPSSFWSLYLNPMTTARALGTILKYQPGTNSGFRADVFYTYGWWCDYKLDQHLTEDTATISLGPADCSDEALEAVLEIVDLCRENDIELTVFLNPVYKLSYDAAVADADYLGFKSRLSDIVEYIDFSGDNALCNNIENYVDSAHYTAEVGDQIIEELENRALKK